MEHETKPSSVVVTGAGIGIEPAARASGDEPSATPLLMDHLALHDVRLPNLDSRSFA